MWSLFCLLFTMNLRPYPWPWRVFVFDALIAVYLYIAPFIVSRNWLLAFVCMWFLAFIYPTPVIHSPLLCLEGHCLRSGAADVYLILQNFFQWTETTILAGNPLSRSVQCMFWWVISSVSGVIPFGIRTWNTCLNLPQ